MPQAAIKRFRRLPEDEQSRVIEMAWEDRTPFEAIERLFGLAEPDVIEVMRHQMKPGSFRLWRKRVTGRTTKHQALRSACVASKKSAMALSPVSPAKSHRAIDR